MENKIYHVMFLCTGNSARSIMAEKLLDHWGKGRFKTYSAGSFPNGTVNPYAIKTLEHHGLSTRDLRSKSWDEFSGPDAPQLDFIFTVCDNAAGETCPVWPGHPLTAHWGVEDPAAVTGTEAEKLAAFRQAFIYLENRIKLLVTLPLEKLEHLKIQSELDAIGKTNDHNNL